MPYIPDVPIAEGNIHGYRTSRPMVTCHRTYGGWGGDYSVISSQGLAHLLIGKEEGQWVQFGPTEALFYHCNGSNDGYGIEMTGVNEDDFTDWQIRCLRYVVPKLRDLIGVPLTYSDGTDGWVNGHTYVGFHAHNGIMTDDGSSQHTNLWKMSDWNKIVGGSITPSNKDSDVANMYVTKKTDPNVGIWVTDGMCKRHILPDEWAFIQFISGGSAGVVPLSDQWWDSIPTLDPGTSLTLGDIFNVAKLINDARDKVIASMPKGSGSTGGDSPAIYNVTLTGEATPK